MGQPMGIGRLGDADLVFKRKFRWTLFISTPCGVVEESYVKLASRPNISIEETEINFLNAKTWIPGKASWETITVTYYDVGNANEDLWNWLASVYDFTDPINLKQGGNRASYAGFAELVLFDGCGNRMEEWELDDVWPQAINFGELDYSSSEEVTVELTLRYSSVSYTNYCGAQVNPCLCQGC